MATRTSRVPRSLVLTAATVLAATPLLGAVPAVAADPVPAAAPVAVPQAAAAYPTASTITRPSEVRTLALPDSTPALRAAGPGAPSTLHDSGARTTAPFTMVGVSWRRGSSADAVFTVRTHTNGTWTGWSTLSSTDVGPDAGRADDRASARSATDPLWVGASDGVQVRLVSSSKRPADVKVELVDPGTASSDTALAVAPTSSPVPPSRTARVIAARAPGVAPPIITRGGWGADESLRSFNPNCAKPDYGTTVKMGFVHHTDNANTYSAADVPGILRGIYAYHVKSNRWCDVGYNYLVDRFGRIFEGRFGGITMPVIGAHTGGYNLDTFGTSLIGTFTSVAPPAAMMNSLADLFAWKLGSYYRNPQGKTVLTAAAFAGNRYPTGTRVTLNTISGHRDADLTSCPGDRAYALLPSLRSMVAARLPHSAIAARYATLGGPGGTLGEPVLSGEKAIPYGLMTRFQRGSITFATSTGARMLSTPFTDTFVATGGVTGPLGYPINGDDRPTGDGRGRYATFQRGWMHYSTATGARETHGLIAARYVAIGFESSMLGFPMSNETVAPDGVGRYNRFQGGYLMWTPSTGAHEVDGPIVAAWARLGLAPGVFGYPTGNPTPTSDLYGRMQTFQRGAIYEAPGTGAHGVRGAIRDRYVALGAERGWLGYPTVDEHTLSPGVVQSGFQRGTITWNTTTGAVTVSMPPA
ncbi:MAG: hypothetical protein QOC80_3160 [Frankiaceae bacterium]|nr:hypothetical protein [Frankiaceae bacterium]